MTKLEEYIEKYRGLHNATDGFISFKPYKPDSPPVHYEAGHSHGLFVGQQFLKKLTKFIKYLSKKKKRAITVLDYGCGQALHVGSKDLPVTSIYHRIHECIQCFWLYDPAVERYSEKPPKGLMFDFVGCSDVMEHIPLECTDEVLQDISSYLKPDGLAVFSIAGLTSSKMFKDGENLHCTLKSNAWWMEKLKEHFDNFVLIYSSTDSAEYSLKDYDIPRSGTSVDSKS